MNYEVGKYYKVPVAILINDDGNPCGEVEVIEPAHNDKQFGVAFTHYHVDGRFISDLNPHYHVDELGQTNQIVFFGEKCNSRIYSKEIVYKRRKCKRINTGLNPPQHAKAYWDWRITMLGKSCKGKKCPHLGVEMMDNGKTLVCPIHNLIGCKTKEIIIG